MMQAPPTPDRESVLPSPLLVTLDTNVLDVKRISEVRAAVGDRAVSFATVTINERGRGGFSVEVDVVPETAVWGESRWGEAVWGGPIPELLILDETPLGSGVLAGDEDADVLERVLGIVSNGSFRTRVQGNGSRHRSVASFETLPPPGCGRSPPLS